MPPTRVCARRVEFPPLSSDYTIALEFGIYFHAASDRLTSRLSLSAHSPPARRQEHEGAERIRHQQAESRLEDRLIDASRALEAAKSQLRTLAAAAEAARTEAGAKGDEAAKLNVRAFATDNCPRGV
jgi:hypothetical protein